MRTFALFHQQGARQRSKLEDFKDVALLEAGSVSQGHAFGHSGDGHAHHQL